MGIDVDKLASQAAARKNAGLPYFKFEDANGDKHTLEGIAVEITDEYQETGQFAFKTDPKTGKQYPNMVRDYIFQNPQTGELFRLKNGSLAMLDAYSIARYEVGDLVEIKRIGSGRNTEYKIKILQKNAGVKPQTAKQEQVANTAQEVFEEAPPF